mmetsp:Transcript_68903/g.151904  ORF Transcript_68903/g.151904 Transcript_68903/m.151904 type:complete len:213 (+) Transcript_68903:180-818(+)
MINSLLEHIEGVTRGDCKHARSGTKRSMQKCRAYGNNFCQGPVAHRHIGGHSPLEAALRAIDFVHLPIRAADDYHTIPINHWSTPVRGQTNGLKFLLGPGRKSFEIPSSLAFWAAVGGHRMAPQSSSCGCVQSQDLTVQILLTHEGSRDNHHSQGLHTCHMPNRWVAIARHGSFHIPSLRPIGHMESSDNANASFRSSLVLGITAAVDHLWP